MQYPDSREDALREVCSLGNKKAVEVYIQSGVNINAAHKINGWTPLHWAAHRGNEAIVQLLLRNGADPSLKTSKGQTAADLAKSDAVMALLQDSTKTGAPPEPDLPITPRYLSDPDLEKLWSVPDSSAARDFTRPEPQQPTAAATMPASPPEAGPSPVPAAHSEPNPHQAREILVYTGARENASLLGAIFAQPADTLEDTVQRIREEIDDVPEAFVVARHNGTTAIPINRKQMTKNTLEHFRSHADAIVLLPPKAC
ncbi:uncharacterized protein VTP21DRAFT_5185 [Calcarisporiella thermophila]|uniref:uncharacterized protein n=1 Tax=Calcarisporiella thermophila TaxID=911321 RepID=UPI003743E355